MSGVIIAGDTSGSVALNAPAVAGTNTLTLPAMTGSLVAVTGSAPSYAARAWVNFNGTGTVAIRASGNVSSITDHATGQYTVNFTTEMQDIDFACVGACATLPGRNGMTVQITRQQSTTYANTTLTQRIWVVDDAGNNGDVEFVSVAVFR